MTTYSVHSFAAKITTYVDKQKIFTKIIQVFIFQTEVLITSTHSLGAPHISSTFFPWLQITVIPLITNNCNTIDCACYLVPLIKEILFNNIFFRGGGVLMVIQYESYSIPTINDYDINIIFTPTDYFSSTIYENIL